ncbi:MAG: ABC transporter ATP-binding protein [Roseburia sp.]
MKEAVRQEKSVPAIEIKNLKAAYEENIIIENMNLAIPKGKVTIIIGANGCGKSTLLKSIARILPVKSGNIYLNGKNMKHQAAKNVAKQMAVLPQSPKCPEAITVRELVGYGRFPYQKAMGGMTLHDKEVIDWAIEKTGLIEFAERPVSKLSGGQRQRAWIAMTLAQETEIILLDEPTTYLDMAYQLEVLQLLQQLNLEKQLTIVMVLHDLNEACRFADHIIGLKKGKIVCEGRPAEVIQTETLREIYGIEATLQMSPAGYPICLEFEKIEETIGK